MTSICAARLRRGLATFALVCAACVAVTPASDAAGLEWRGIATFTARGEEEALDLNRNNYRDSGFDPIRARLFLDVPMTDHLAVFGQVLFDEASVFPARTYGLYAMASNFGIPDMSVEVGKLPSIFGTFAPRAYENKNPLIAHPLAYQYHTTLRADQIPMSPAALIEMRGRGQQGVSYEDFHGNPSGASGTQSGSPILYDTCWDIGAVALGTWRWLEYAGGVTMGTVGMPMRSRDSNDGRQLVGRLGFVPVTGLRISLSGARGPYLATAVRDFLPEGVALEDYDQFAKALSIDYSFGHASFVAEVVDNGFESPWIPEELGTTAWYAEGKYTFLPGAYFAARFDQLEHSEIAYEDPETFEMKRATWDQDVQRIETAIGYWVTSGILTRVDLQLWDENAGPWTTTSSLVACQAVVTF
jgi:hypothetical protein